MSNTRILLIGGNGFVGEQLACFFVKIRKYTVASYDLNPMTKCDHIEVFTGDILCIENLLSCMKKFIPTIVIHLASFGIPDPSMS